MGRRIRVVQRSANGEDPQLRWDGPIHAQQKMIMGREGDITVGTNPVDRKISRHAVTVTATDRGWSVLPTNRNGVALHPWAQPSYLVSTRELLVWPRIGIRIIGSPELEHWVLLEDDEAYTRGAARHTTGFTDHVMRPLPLTAKQLEAVRLVFRDVLAWPPRISPEVLFIKQAATALMLTNRGVQARLTEVLRRAQALGLVRQDMELTDPGYVYALTTAGYIEPTRADLHRPLTLL